MTWFIPSRTLSLHYINQPTEKSFCLAILYLENMLAQSAALTFKDAELGPYLQVGDFFSETGEHCHTSHGHQEENKSSAGKI